MPAWFGVIEGELWVAEAGCGVEFNGVELAEVVDVELEEIGEDGLVVSSGGDEFDLMGMQRQSPGNFALLLCGFDGLGEGGDYFEEVADDAVVGYFKDGGVGVFVDGYDALGTLHADEVLDGAADSYSEIELGGDGLAGTADLALHGEPAVVADGAGGGELGSEGVGELLDDGDVVGVFDAAADADDERSSPEVDGLRAAAEGRAGGGSDLGGLDLRLEWQDGGLSRLGEIDAEGSCLDRDKAWAVACVPVNAVQAALHELTSESWTFVDGDYVADKYLSEPCGQTRDIIARLVGVREDDIRRFELSNQLLEGEHVAVCGVVSKSRVLDGIGHGRRFPCGLNEDVGI